MEVERGRTANRTRTRNEQPQAKLKPRQIQQPVEYKSRFDVLKERTIQVKDGSSHKLISVDVALMNRLFNKVPDDIEALRTLLNMGARYVKMMQARRLEELRGTPFADPLPDRAYYAPILLDIIGYDFPSHRNNPDLPLSWFLYFRKSTFDDACRQLVSEADVWLEPLMEHGPEDPSDLPYRWGRHAIHRLLPEPGPTQFKPGICPNPAGRPPKQACDLPYDGFFEDPVPHCADGKITTVARLDWLIGFVRMKAFKKFSPISEDIVRICERLEQERLRRKTVMRLVDPRIVPPPAMGFSLRGPEVIESIAACLRLLGMVSSRSADRMILEPWIVEQRLALIDEEHALPPQQQWAIALATRPGEVRWPDWWEVRTAADLRTVGTASFAKVQRQLLERERLAELYRESMLAGIL